LPNKERPEHVLCIERKSLFVQLHSKRRKSLEGKGIIFTNADWDERCKKISLFSPRELNTSTLPFSWVLKSEADKTFSKIQPIPYLIFLTPEGKVLIFVRPAHDEGDERLFGKIAFPGGHISERKDKDPQDKVFSTIINCIYREFEEETHHRLPEINHLLVPKGYFYAPVKEVDQMHICLPFVVKLEESSIDLEKMCKDNEEVEEAKFVTIEELIKLSKEKKEGDFVAETWVRMIANAPKHYLS